jgi:hypothetical protein
MAGYPWALTNACSFPSLSIIRRKIYHIWGVAGSGVRFLSLSSFVIILFKRNEWPAGKWLSILTWSFGSAGVLNWVIGREHRWGQAKARSEIFWAGDEETEARVLAERTRDPNGIGVRSRHRNWKPSAAPADAAGRWAVKRGSEPL